VPTLREAEAAGNTSDGDVDQQLLIDSAGGDNLPDVPLPNGPHPDVAPPDVLLPEALADGLVGKESACPSVAEEEMSVAFWLGSGSCLVCFL
jgi:hypothetical protein